MIVQLITLLGLWNSSREDIKKHEISLFPVIAMIGVGIFVQRTGSVSLLIRSALPGLLVCALSWIAGGVIGMGDGWVLLAVGCLNSEAVVWSTFGGGLFLAGVCSLFLMTVLHRNRKTELPLVPFLLAGYVITLVGMGG